MAPFRTFPTPTNDLPLCSMAEVCLSLAIAPDANIFLNSVFSLTYEKKRPKEATQEENKNLFLVTVHYRVFL